MTTTINGLGTIVMYSLSSEIHVTIQDFHGRAYQMGIPLCILPNALTDAGAFQQATTAAASAFVLKEEPILCKEVKNDGETIVRTFEKRILDGEEAREDIKKGKENIPVYKHVATMVYDKRTGKISPIVLHPEGRAIVTAAAKNFKEIRSQYNIKQVRKTIQNAFKYYGSISLRHNGGVNFIPASSSDEWKKFSEFIEYFEGVEIVSINVKNDVHNKTAIRRALEDDINSSIKDEIKKLGGESVEQHTASLIRDFGEALSEGHIGKAGLQSMLERFNDTVKIVGKYKDVLNMDLSILDSQMAIAKQQVVTMLSTYGADE